MFADAQAKKKEKENESLTCLRVSKLKDWGEKLLLLLLFVDDDVSSTTASVFTSD